MYTRLLHSQQDYRGPLACTLASCYLAHGCLSDQRLAGSLTSRDSLHVLDSYLWTACKRWNELNSDEPSKPMRHAKEALKDDSTLGELLELVNEYWTVPSSKLVDSEFGFEITGTVLERWMDEPGETCCVVNSSDAFTYLIVPPLDGRAVYTVIDTHEGAAERRQHAMPGVQRDLGGTGSGLIWTTVFEEDVCRFVESYCNTGSTQIDLSILKSREDAL